MHQIQPNGSIKGLFKKYKREHKTQTEDKQKEASRRMKQEENTETQKQESHYSKSITLYFAFMNIVFEIQTKSQLSQNPKIENALKVGTSSHTASFPM